jgi:hypothetical protein
VLIDAVHVTNEHIPIFRPIVSQLAHKATEFQGLHSEFIRSRVWFKVQLHYVRYQLALCRLRCVQVLVFFFGLRINTKRDNIKEQAKPTRDTYTRDLKVLEKLRRRGQAL